MKNATKNAIATTTTTATTTAKNATKNNVTRTFDGDFTKLFHAHGIGVYSTRNQSTAYRIMRDGSSLNVKKRGFVIYTTDRDIENVENAKLDGVTVERNTNSTDKVRPHIVRVSDFETLEKVLDAYAQNANNGIA